MVGEGSARLIKWCVCVCVFAARPRPHTLVCHEVNAKLRNCALPRIPALHCTTLRCAAQHIFYSTRVIRALRTRSSVASPTASVASAFADEVEPVVAPDVVPTSQWSGDEMRAIFIAPVIRLSGIPPSVSHWTAVVPTPPSFVADVVGSDPCVLSSHLASEPLVFSIVVDGHQTALSSPQTSAVASSLVPVVSQVTHEVVVAIAIHVSAMSVSCKSHHNTHRVSAFFVYCG